MDFAAPLSPSPLVFRTFYDQDDRYRVAGVSPMRFALFRDHEVLCTYSPSSSGDCHVEYPTGDRLFVRCLRYPVSYALVALADRSPLGRIDRSVSRLDVRIVRLATGLVAEDRWCRPSVFQVQDAVGPLVEYGRRGAGVELRSFSRTLAATEWHALIHLSMTRLWLSHLRG